jgi:hypothetical protein
MLCSELMPSAVTGLVAGDFAPGVVELVGREQRPHLGVHAVRQDAQRVVFHQFGNVAGVARGQLHIGVVDRGFFADGAFELEDHQRQAVDVEDGVGDAFLGALDLQLVNDAVDVGLRAVVRLTAPSQRSRPQHR